MNLGKLLTLTKPQFSPLENGDDNGESTSIGLLRELNKITPTKCLAPSLAWDKCSRDFEVCF